MTPPLTSRQQWVLDFIAEFIAEHGFSPTVRDLRNGLGIKSTNGVMCHLWALRKKGRITWTVHNARTIRVLPQTAEC